MIVSGFTQKNVKEEHFHGSTLDHAHCVTCVSRSCRVTADNVTSCDVTDCPRGCHSRYHCCKEEEHVSLCPEERVACINSMYGCPVFLHRKKLADHLATCPASIVHCRAEWNRLHIEPVKQGEAPPVLMKKIYVDCGQLDTALAMRDHRTLVDMFLAHQRTCTIFRNPLLQTYPAAPVGQMSSSSDSDVCREMSSSDEKVHLKKQEAMSNRRAPVYDVSRQIATSLPSLVSCISDQMASKSEQSWTSPRKDGMDSAAAVLTNEERCAGTSAQDRPGKDGIFLDDKRHSVIQDGQSLRSLMSLNLGVECIARCQPKTSNTFTFVCAQDVRRDEFPHHFYAVHDRIQSDLGGWMEQRCPLAYLGCPFSFRRFCPRLPGMTVCHSWLLESFGVTNHRGDFSHQTPSHLLTNFPETADIQSTSTNTDRSLQMNQLQQLDDQPPSKSGEHKYTRLNPKPSCVSSEDGMKMTSEKSQNEMSSISLFTVKVEEISESSNKVPLSYPCYSGDPHDPQSVGQSDDYFSSLLDGVSLEEQDPQQVLMLSNCQVKESQGQQTQPVSIAGQATEMNVQENCSVDLPGNTEPSPEQSQNTPQEEKAVPSIPSSQQPMPSLGCGLPESGSCQPWNSVSDSLHVEPKQVIYTGLGGSSCVRVDDKVRLSKSTSDTINTTSSLQLEDMPLEIICHISRFLDSFSLYNLSLVSRSMRELCSSLLQERGMVSLVWEKQQIGDKMTWHIVGKCWSFSSSFEPVESWCFTGHNPIPDHLRSCPYNQDRIQHSDKFSIIPLCETPLNIQIRDMLQELLQRRRDFRGWIIRSNFEREHVSEALPLMGPFAGVLVALGGTLPQ